MTTTGGPEGPVARERRVSYGLLGPLEVSGDQRLLTLGGAKQRALLALLLLDANRVVSRERLVDSLWGDVPPETAVTSVQVYVSRLRKLLPDGAIATRGAGYMLEADPEEIDLKRFERLLDEARSAEPERAAQLLRAALALWRGPPLEEFAEPFARIEGGRLEDLRFAALEERIGADLALGRGADLVGELEGLIAEQPHRERLRAQLMLALYRSGRQAEALAAYREARSALDELGIDPSEELRRLESQILRQDATLLPAARTTNLPDEPTPLIGRTRELADVRWLVRASRLVTLTGAGGSGKTRLALQAARELVGDFADGVWFVSLASLADPELAEPTIMQALDVRGQLNDFVRGKQLLLVLDNLEQLLPGIATVVAGVEAKVLATSRERLNVSAEQEYPVPTLPLGDAVALFTHRARQLQPRFQPDEHVTEIARRLDGLPLALEFAAARVKVLTPAQILERLRDSLDLLSGGGRDRPERQRTLRATLEWSYGLLNAEERRTFARLGIFASNFDVDLAREVAEADIDGLQSLVDKSLLVRTNDDRFAMLEIVRAFAREQLDASVFETLRRRQFRLMEQIAERSPSWVDSLRIAAEEHLVWLEEVERLLPDIRDVLAWALTIDPGRAGVLICRLEPGLAVRGGGAREVEQWLQALLRRRSALPGAVVAEALVRLGHYRRLADDLDAAVALLRESIELFRRLGDQQHAAWATNRYARALAARGGYAEALKLFERNLAYFRDLDNRAMVANTLHMMGNTLLELGDLEQARESVHQAISTAESTGQDITHILHSLADVELGQRKLDEAERVYIRARDSADARKDRSTVAYCLGGLASIAALRGDVEGAGEHWGHVQRIEVETGERIDGLRRERYERILEPITNDPAFRRGYEAGRLAETATAPSLYVPTVPLL